MAENKKTKKKPYLPIDGSEEPHPILIPLQNFQFRHDTYSDDVNTKGGLDSDFIGRDNLVEQLGKLLSNTKGKRGSYLIAGYRGSGKTCLINRVINKYKEGENKVIFAKINLGHDGVLDTRHVLFNIISVLSHEFKESQNKINSKLPRHLLCVPLIIILCLFFCLQFIVQSQDRTGKQTCEVAQALTQGYLDSFTCLLNLHWPLYLWEFSLGILMIVVIVNSRVFEGLLSNLFYFFEFGRNEENITSLNKKIQDLYNKVAYSFEKDIGTLRSRSAGIGFLHKTKIPEMKEPQIELELNNFLELSSSCGYEVLLVFDELDKISLTVTESSTSYSDPIENINQFDKETVDENVYRRKKRVDSLLASLKTLITVGQAKFFFIAGRDMLDSYQSEKGSTSSLYESLFHQVYEVPSFLTDDSDQEKTRLDSMIEVFVCSRLLDNKTADLYWQANELCGEVINDQVFIGLIDTYTKLEKSSKSTFINDIIDQFLIKIINLEGCDWLELKHNKIISYEEANEIFRGCIQNEIDRFKKSIVSDIDSNRLFSYTSFFIREVLIFLLLCPEIGKVIQKSNYISSLENSSEKKYAKTRLNIFYLYLRHSKEVAESDAKIIIFTLKQFINYLTVHSWGNCKRLTSLFESFTKPVGSNSIHNAMDWLPYDDEETKYMLHFGVTERQRISMGSNLYIMFNHHLNRQFTGADKLVVSTMAALHYCMKFHRSAFSRHHLFRMTEMMSIYSSPELISLFETTLTQVLWPYTRAIRNGMLQYRFFTWIEQEIRYIARVDDLESASYTFSLDAINNIKAHYRKTLENVMSTYKMIETCSQERGPGLIAEINIVLGDIYLLERAYDESVIYYQTAVNAHHNLDKEKKYHLECLMRFVEALLKLGNAQEHRQRYDRAAMNYYQAKQLVDDFMKYQDNSSTFFFVKSDQSDKGEISDFLTDGDSKWVLLKQPHWALLYLNLKRGHGDRCEIEVPANLYGKKGKNYTYGKDPYGEYRKGQLCFFLGRHPKAKEAFTKVIKFFSDEEGNKSKQEYYSFYLIPTACINLAENELVHRMNVLSKQLETRDFESLEEKIIYAQNCRELLESMKSLVEFDKLVMKENISDWLKINKQINMKEILMLIFYSAQQYEKLKLYDHAAMAYLKALSLWLVAIDMLARNYLDSTLTEQLNKIGNKMELENCWFKEASNKALFVISASNGQAQEQAREKWHLRDIADFPKKETNFNTQPMGNKVLSKLYSPKGRKELNEDIAFLHGSYLGQQLIAMQNWFFTTKRELLNDEPAPFESYRIPLYTTRSLILSSWVNGRERLGQAKLIRNLLKTRDIRSNKCAKNICDDLREKHEQSGKATEPPSNEICYYIISAKGIHDFYTALYYMRILTDNNQAIVIPPPTFVILKLWRLVYGLVDYEKSQSDKKNYEQSRLAVRTKLVKFVSKDTPRSHLDLDYLEKATIRLLQTVINMGNTSSSSRKNILQNKYFLNDDYEDPGFHLDWTVVQMLIPSAMMSIKLVKEKMKSIKG